MGIKESKSLRISPQYSKEKNQEENNLLNPFLPVYICDDKINEKTFFVESVISNGAFGDVLKVKCILDNKIYAMKMMKKIQLIESEAVQQAKDEATIQDSVSFHERIVKTFWFFQNQESIFIIMEYLPGGELFEFWKNTKYFEEKIVKVYLAEMALVLDFLHDFGIIYRDLKLENILLDSRGHLKLTDFGLAKRLRKGQRTRTICGTLHYIAPEIAEGGSYGHKSDWWSLGILAYVLLVGQFPLNGVTSHLEMFNLMIHTTYSIPPYISYDSGVSQVQRKISESMRNLTSRLLEINEEKRLFSIRDFEMHPAYNGFNFEKLYLVEMPLPSKYLQQQEQLINTKEFNDFDIIDISKIPTNHNKKSNNTVIPHYINTNNLEFNYKFPPQTNLCNYTGKENFLKSEWNGNFIRNNHDNINQTLISPPISVDKPLKNKFNYYTISSSHNVNKKNPLLKEFNHISKKNSSDLPRRSLLNNNSNDLIQNKYIVNNKYVKNSDKYELSNVHETNYNSLNKHDCNHKYLNNAILNNSKNLNNCNQIPCSKNIYHYNDDKTFVNIGPVDHEMHNTISNPQYNSNKKPSLSNLTYEENKYIDLESRHSSLPEDVVHNQCYKEFFKDKTFLMGNVDTNFGTATIHNDTEPLLVIPSPDSYSEMKRAKIKMRRSRTLADPSSIENYLNNREKTRNKQFVDCNVINNNYNAMTDIGHLNINNNVDSSNINITGKNIGDINNKVSETTNNNFLVNLSKMNNSFRNNIINFDYNNYKKEETYGTKNQVNNNNFKDKNHNWFSYRNSGSFGNSHIDNWIHQNPLSKSYMENTRTDKMCNGGINKLYNANDNIKDFNYRSRKYDQDILYLGNRGRSIDSRCNYSIIDN